MKRSRKKSLRLYIFGLTTGLVIMFLLDMVFHFNNSVETKLKRELDKAVNRVEEIFK